MFIVQIVRDDVLDIITHMGIDRAEAETKFIKACQKYIKDWSKYSPSDMAAVLDDGYEVSAGVGVNFIDTSCTVTDNEIAKMVNSGMSLKLQSQKIKKWISCCNNFGELDTVDELINLADEYLAGIVGSFGQNLFMGPEKKWYVLTTKAMIEEANPLFVKEMLEKQND